MRASGRHWFKVSLRTILVAVAIVSIFMGWCAREANFVRERKAFLQEGRASSSDLLINSETLPTVPFWRRWLGDEAECRVTLREEAADTDFEAAKRLFPEAQSIAFAVSYAEVLAELVKFAEQDRLSSLGTGDQSPFARHEDEPAKSTE